MQLLLFSICLLSIANACNHNDPKDSPYNSTTVGCFVQKNPEDSLYSTYSVAGKISFDGDKLVLNDFNLKVVAKEGIDPIFNFTVEILARDQWIVDRRPLEILPTHEKTSHRRTLRNGDKILRIPVNLVDGVYTLSIPSLTTDTERDGWVSFFYNNSNVVEFLIAITDGVYNSGPGKIREQIIGFQKNADFGKISSPDSSCTSADSAPTGNSTAITHYDPKSGSVDLAGLIGISQSGAAGYVLSACTATVAFAFAVCLA